MAATLPIGMPYCGPIRRLVSRRAAGCTVRVGRCVPAFLVSAALLFFSSCFDGWFSLSTYVLKWPFHFYFLVRTTCSAEMCLARLLYERKKNIHLILSLLDHQMKPQSLDTFLWYINAFVVKASSETVRFVPFGSFFLFPSVEGATVVRNSQLTNSLWGQRWLKTRINGNYYKKKRFIIEFLWVGVSHISSFSFISILPRS